MKYSETGFRAIYKNFCVFPIVDKIASVVEMFPGYEEADCCLGYGYVDHTAGVSLEVLALGKTTEDGFFQFFDGNDKTIDQRQDLLFQLVFHQGIVFRHAIAALHIHQGKVGNCVAAVGSCLITEIDHLIAF